MRIKDIAQSISIDIQESYNQRQEAHLQTCRQAKQGKDCGHTVRGNKKINDAREEFGFKPKGEVEVQVSRILRNSMGYIKLPRLGWATATSKEEIIRWLAWFIMRGVGDGLGALTEIDELYRQLKVADKRLLDRYLEARGINPKHVADFLMAAAKITKSEEKNWQDIAALL